MKENYALIAKTFYGLEDLLKEELFKIGATDIEKGTRMVRFKGDKELLYKANIYLRTALRILKTIHSFEIQSQEDYYEYIHNIEWEKYLGLHHSFAIDSVVNSKIFKNSLFASQRAKDAIVDRFRAKYHKRPLVNIQNPDVLVNVHISGNKVDLALDSSGVSLHRRGYREEEGAAPLNQALAAALIYMSGWQYENPFIDPMTGSGTLAIEAAMIARNIPPGLLRKDYCFQNWQDYDKILYRKIIEDVRLNDIKPVVFANDMSSSVLDIARNNALKANVTSFIKFSNKSFNEFKPRAQNGTIIFNPPYGERIKVNQIKELYQDIGNSLKKYFSGFDAWVISSNKEALKFLGLKPDKKIKVFNGSLECSYNKYTVFDGSFKDYKTGNSEN